MAQNRQVKVVQTNQIYPSIAAAGRALGVSAKAISQCLNPNHPRKSVGEYTFDAGKQVTPKVTVFTHSHG